MKKIAIIGAGFSGLALAYYLRNHDVTIYDPNGVGGQASGLAAGLLHPFGGAHAKLNRFGREGLQATQNLLDIASDALGTPTYDQTGLLRLAVTDQQKVDYNLTAQKYSDVEWWEPEQCQEKIPELLSHPGIYIPSAITVHAKLYLQGLYLAGKAPLIKEKVSSLKQLDTYDNILIAAGAHIHELATDLPFHLRPIKGQILQFEWPKNTPPLPCSLNSKGYLVMTSDGQGCIGGTTYEKKFTSNTPTEDAKQIIIDKISFIYPPIQNMKCIDHQAAIRIAAPDHLPLIKQVSDKAWIMTGLGSKGLLYHALWAQQLAEKI